MSDGYMRHHESGTAKREKRRKKEEDRKKMKGSIESFLKPKPKDKDNGSAPSSTLIDTDTPGPADSQQLQHSLHRDITSEEQNTSPKLPDPVEEAMIESHPTQGLKVQQDPASTQVFDSDPAKWHVSPDLIDYFSKQAPPQNIPPHNHYMSERDFGGSKRYVRQRFFTRTMNNGETVNREWLIYSLSMGTTYCYVCKLFCATPVSTDKDNAFVKGYYDWRNADARIRSHETSKDHRLNICKLVEKQTSLRIDSELVQQQEMERGYWIKVLTRIVAVIQFLAERGLAFRGDSEILGSSNNGNYLGCLELIAQFDDFLAEHIRLHGNPGRGHVSYLSSTICDEFIKLLAEKVKCEIVEQVKSAKYFGLSVDSTPDLAHLDQLTLILRYTLSDGSVVERFIGFLIIENHGAEHLFDTVMQILKEMDIDISNCRSQSYDNASNMAGIYTGVQARVLEVNPLADFVPCSAHSLNLVGSASAECCKEAVSFFGVLQGIYNFLSASPQRWAQFMENMKKKVYVVKSLSETRWSARADATKALALNYSEVLETLSEIAESPATKPEAANQASSLVQSLKRLETALMCKIWNDILTKTNIVSKALQEAGIEICTVVKLLNSLVNHLENIRDSFDSFEDQAKELVSDDYKESTVRKRARKAFFDEASGTDAVLTPKEHFRTQTFLVIVDRLLQEMKKRSKVYQELGNRFDFLTDFSMSDSNTFREKADGLVQYYQSDLEADFTDEIILLRNMLTTERHQAKSVNDMLQYVISKNLAGVFPNVCIAFRIYLSILATSCEGERSFSTLKRVKNYSRATMGQEKVTNLALLCIESQMMKNLNIDHIIKCFATMKCRKANI